MLERARQQDRLRVKLPEAVKAKSAVQSAIRARRLSREPCEVCGATEVEGHHEDYAKPLEVHWLCRKHHHDLHQWKRRGAPTSQIFLFWQDRVLWQHRNLGKVPVRAVKRGTIVRFKGEWGVLESGRFCSWEGPAFRLRPDELVEVLVERKKK